MLIRSQDKRMLCPLKPMCVHPLIKNEKVYGRIIEKYQIHICIGAEYGIIAEYSTEEKAIKVLDMICEKYQEPICENEIEDYVKLTYKNIIFQMPKDEEVKV